MKTKKVFSTDKWLETCIKYNTSERLVFHSIDSEWIYKCEGMTKQQIESIGYEVSDEWLIEVEDTEANE